MVAEFGIDNVSVAVKTAYNNNDHTQRFEVEMLIVKNNEYKPDQLKPGNFPWQSFYWERGNQQQFLRISGYKEQPFIMPRWTKVANCEYGYGLGIMPWVTVCSCSVSRKQSYAVWITRLTRL